MRKKKHEEHENMERWLISYADFITLLFAFFVVMYSTASINEGKLRAVAEAINSAFNPIIALSSSNIRITREQAATEALKLDMPLYLQVTARIKEIDSSGRVHVVKEKRGVVIRIEDNMIFETGQAAIFPEFEPILDRIAGYLAGIPNRVQIEGHTDNIPIRTLVYPSNWELSTARATSVLRYLVERRSLDPARLAIAGYGEFRPIVANDTLEDRAKNRRVEIVILNRDIDPTPSAVEMDPPAGP
jgi:chemotaxis protein MotB